MAVAGFLRCWFKLACTKVQGAIVDTLMSASMLVWALALTSVVHSILSLTSLLRVQLVKCFTTL